MKLTTCRMLMAVFAIGLCADVLAEAKRDYPQISLCGPGGSQTPRSRDDLVMLVIDGPTISCDGNRIPDNEVVEYVNKLLEVKRVSYIGVYTREGPKYGDVVRGIDILRGTNAKNIGLSMQELAVGREP